MHYAIDARYVRERPSGIGAYIHAIGTRLPKLAPMDSFAFLTHPDAPAGFGEGPNARRYPESAIPNGPATLLRHGSLGHLPAVDVFHAPFNILGRGVHGAAVSTIHDLMWLHSPWLCEGASAKTPIQWFFYRDGIRRAIQNSARVVAISAATADDITKHFPEATSRVRVIPHGVEPVFAPPSDRAQAELRVSALLGGSSAPYLLLVGQNAPYKNQEAVLRALPLLRDKHIRVVLLQRLHPGRGLARLADKLGIAHRVLWRSALPESDLLTLYQCAQALVQPSRFEGFGMPVLEAMATGTPVVTSNLPVFREITAGAGLVAEDAQGLVQALDMLLSDTTLRQELGIRGRERSKAFDWDLSAKAHLEVYQEATVAKNRPLSRR